ncbi:MAG: serine/threonine-protein kinase [Labilithrix sp.]
MNHTTEEGRALLQDRVALFWKVMFFNTLLSSGLGALGAIVKPGWEFVFALAQTAQTGLFWWLSARGERSAVVLRSFEVGGLLLNLTAGALVGRFVVSEFAAKHGVISPDGLLMADGYVSMLHVAGFGLWLAVRAALIPSAPRFTILVTLVCGIPLVACNVVVPNGHRALVLRAADSGAYPWLPMTAALVWVFVIVTCAVISWVIWGLRAEVREARRLGQYVLEKKIGEGGMGEVYRARHGMMRRPSALKLLRGDSATADRLQRFEREVQLTARLTHPNTITIFDYGRTHDGVFYYAMELLDGATLQRIVTVSGAQPAGRVVRILRMAVGALIEAHEIGLIHRDIKPANIMLCRQGGERDVVKLLDFGLVKELEVDGDAKLTGTNTIMGTPQYMAPESILDPDSVDTRADLYALGAVAYYLLAGVDVFQGKSVLELCGKHVHEAPKPFADRGVDVPRALEAVILACLEKRPDDRPASAAELRRCLDACGVEAWEAADAAAWWEKHEAALDDDMPKPDRDHDSDTNPRTIAVGART